MLVLLTLGTLIAIYKHCSKTGHRRKRNGHIRTVYSLGAAGAVIALAALLVLWPMAIAGECSLLRYCRVGFNDGWVATWVFAVGLLCFIPFISLMAYVVSGRWVQEWCCDGPHPTFWEVREQADAYRKQLDRLASLGFTEAECWPVQRDAAFVAAELGNLRICGEDRYYELADDRIVVSARGWDMTCSGQWYLPDFSQCGEDCRHGEEVRVAVMMDSGRSLEVLRAVNWDPPQVTVFRPGEWIAYLSADLRERAEERITERVAAQEAAETAAEKARKRELDSRFAWVEDVSPEMAGRGGKR